MIIKPSRKLSKVGASACEIVCVMSERERERERVCVNVHQFKYGVQKRLSS